MIRKAVNGDIPEIRRFLSDREAHGVIPRSLAYLYAHRRDYFVYIGESGDMEGIASLHLCWDGIGEIRSVVVKENLQKCGIGKQLVGACLREAESLALKEVFLLCLIPDYFKRFGFRVVTRDELPPIAWVDCINCVKFPACNETPMRLAL
jgi:amino-acid N-acetyltransferase